MDLVNDMKARVETYWSHLKANEPYNKAIMEGRATQSMVTHFLVNIHYLIQHTPIHLDLAIREADKRKLTKLKAFFQNKKREEVGHDKWAENDLAIINQKHILQSQGNSIDPSMKQLIAHIETIITTDPYLYLSYIFFAEYLCVICGPETTEGLEKKCGFPPKSMTVVENHAELDKDHVHEWEGVMKEIVDANIYRPLFFANLEKTIVYHQQFYTSCAESKAHAAA